MPLEPASRVRLRLLGLKIAFAAALAGALALSTGASLEKALRFFAAISGVGSLLEAALALLRRRSFEGGLTAWDEAIVLAGVSAGAHFLAVYLSTR